MKKLILFLTTLLLLFGMCACNSKTEPTAQATVEEEMTWQMQYDLGMRYLSEGNYEEAIIAFELAITIEPKESGAYIGLADAYVGMDDLEKALSILEDAFEATGDTMLQDKIDELKQTIIGEDYVIEWVDSAFEACIREIIEKPDGDVMLSDVYFLTSVRLVGKFGGGVISMGLKTDEVYTIKNMETGEYEEYSRAENGGQIVSLADLKHFENLWQLDIYYNENIDITTIPAMKNLGEVEIRQCAIDDISGIGKVIEGLPELRRLVLSKNNIKDISPLAEMENLPLNLDLSRNEITDISALAGLTNLKRLDLSDNDGITDISTLAGMTNLWGLEIGCSEITDISVLSNLTQLTELDLSHTNVGDYSILSNMKNLEELDLSNTEISDISMLSGLTNLTSLTLYVNNISDISALSNLVELEYLDLSDNLIIDISVLSGLTQLVDLDLQFNEITDWSPVAHVSDVDGRPD